MFVKVNMDTSQVKAGMNFKRIFRPRNYRLEMTLLMLGADLISFVITASLLVFINQFWVLYEVRNVLGVMLAVGGLALVLFANNGLYPGVGINPAEELKRTTYSASIAFGVGFVLIVALTRSTHWFVLSYLIAWLLQIVVCVIMRWVVRMQAARLGLWGEPVVVVGQVEAAYKLATFFAQRRRLGYIPLFIISKSDVQSGKLDHWKRLVSTEAETYSSREVVETALISPSVVADLTSPGSHLSEFLSGFKRCIVVAGTDWLGGVSLSVHGFEGLFGIEVLRNSFRLSDRVIKRSMDLVLGSLLLVFALPVLLAAGLLIKLRSPGPVFFSQLRVGQDGKLFKVYKLRTMVPNAEEILHTYLEEDPKAKAEWDRTQKLKNDPRIIPGAGWLRQYSIDELPQLFNVLKGDMSLVGPRPFLLDQSAEYGHTTQLYFRVKPGLTGLWQVSGRNQTTFKERTGFDKYYIHNWSVWLDLYILLRTIWVVAARHGAY